MIIVTDRYPPDQTFGPDELELGRNINIFFLLRLTKVDRPNKHINVLVETIANILSVVVVVNRAMCWEVLVSNLMLRILLVSPGFHGRAESKFQDH